MSDSMPDDVKSAVLRGIEKGKKQHAFLEDIHNAESENLRNACRLALDWFVNHNLDRWRQNEVRRVLEQVLADDDASTSLLDQAVAMLRQAEPQMPHADYGVAVDIRSWLETNFPDLTTGV